MSVANLEGLTPNEKELYTRAMAVVTLEKMRMIRDFSQEAIQEIGEEFVMACEPFAPTYDAEEVICTLLVTIDELRKGRVA